MAYNTVKPPPFNPASVLKTDTLSVDVQVHVANVFAALAACLLAAAAGVVTHLWTGCGGALSGVASLLTFAWLAIDTEKENGPRRLGILCLFGLLQGMSLGELVALVLEVDPHILLLATLGTTVIFMCFSGAALLAKRRSYLYLGATLGSVTSLLAFASLANIFFRSPLLLDVNLYAGLVCFCGYVIYDTQLMIERAALGSRDFAWHAAELFVDFAAVFVRICIIMLKNAAKKSERDSGSKEQTAANKRR